jgi:hypothetical protein
VIVARRAAALAVALVLAGCGSNTTPGPTTGGPASPPPASAASSNPAPGGSSTAAASPGSAWTIADAARASADPGLVASLAALPAPTGQARYAVTAIRQRGDWALVSIADADRQITSDSGFALAVRAGGAWTVVFGTDPQAFCAALAKAPAGAITQDERDHFTGCH